MDILCRSISVLKEILNMQFIFIYKVVAEMKAELERPVCLETFKGETRGNYIDFL